MDTIHKFLNIIVPLLMLTSLFLILPPLLLFKFLSFIKRSISMEKLAGKVVLITGASSGIGENLAYEYARKGARLALAARREDRLRVVADKARLLGSPDVIVIRTDVSKIEDCERLVHQVVNYFGRLDHLVNNAALLQVDMFMDCTQLSRSQALMDTNFWGAVYCTHFAAPHLKKNRGKIIVISSIAGWNSIPKTSFYNASKAALISFFETLAAEFGSEIGITIVTPGLVESEMTQAQSELHSKVQSMGTVPALSGEGCAKAIVSKVCRGDRYVTEPYWAGMAFLFKVVCPEVLEWSNYSFMVSSPSKDSANAAKQQ